MRRRTRLKFIASEPIRNGVGEAAEFDNPAWPRYIRTTDIAGPTSLRDDTFASLPPEVAALAPVASGDLLMSAAGTVGRTYLHLTDEPACFAGYLVRFRPSGDVDPRFVSYWSQTPEFLDQVNLGAVRSTIDNFSAGKYQNLVIDLPQLPEQHAIADYLDAETARIDRLIAIRRRQMELIDERVTIAIWRGATKGLRAMGMRTSGLGWAGDIPSHWDLPPVEANFEVQLGKMLNPEDAQVGEQFPYLRNLNVQWDRVELDHVNEMHFDPHDRVRYRLVPGDLLVCEGGEVGRAAIWNGAEQTYYYQKALLRVRPRENASVRFLMYALWAAASRRVFAIEGNTSTIVHLTAEKLRAHRLPWPPRGEQDEIVNHLDRVRGQFEQTTVALRRQMELLLERHHALVTAAVIGRLTSGGVAA